MTQTTQTNRFALFFFLYFIAVSMGLSVFALFGKIPEEGYLLLTQFLCYLPPMVLYFWRTKKSVSQTLRLHPLSRKNILLLTAFSFAIQPFMSFLSFLTSLFFPNPVVDSAESFLESGFLVSLLSVAVFPAIFEELSMRGIFLSGYRFLSKQKRAFACALLFGLLHMNLQQFPYAFCVGFIFCFLVERTNSIFASILPHMLINGTTVCSMFAEPEAYTAAATADVSNAALLASVGLLALLSLPVLVFLWYWFLKINPAEPELTLTGADNGIMYQERFCTPSLLLIFVVYLLIGVVPYLLPAL